MKTLSKIVIYGDSLSTGTHGEGGYEGFLRETYHVESVNYAVGSSGLSTATPNNTCEILADPENIPADADLVLLWHGTNDWYWGAPAGHLGDKTPDTFHGAIHTAIHCIREKLPDAVFVYMTPIFRLEQPDGCESVGIAYETPNKLGFTMESYYQALLEESIREGFFVIDMRRCVGIHEYNHEKYLEDKVHPNKAGYEKICRVLKKGLDEVLTYEGYEI